MPRGAPRISESEAIRELARFYRRNAYVRWPRLERVDQETADQYKKGVELRFSAFTPEEAEYIMRLLDRVGIRHGRPFAKGSHQRIPVYGQQRLERFLELIEEVEED
jgi:hypothetical protein